MSDFVKDADETEPGTRPPSIVMGLPDELAEWADQNQALVLRVQNALTATYTSLTEEQLWEAIAGACSPKWQTARKRLQTAETAWEEMQKPDNAPLGAIGLALDGDELDKRREDYTISLSEFTIINEGLRQRQDLRTLLSVLLVQKRMVDQSAAQTAATWRATANLESMFSLSNEFDKAAGRQPRIRRQFSAYARRIFGPKKPAEVTSVTVPWLPKT